MAEAKANMCVHVVEDQPIIQERLRTLFGAHANYRLHGISGTAEDAVQALQSASVDILLLDLELPGQSGEEIIPLVRGQFPELKIVVFTVFEDHARIVRLLRLGIRGYLLKDITDDLLLAELGVICAGGSTLTERVAQTLLSELEPTLADESHGLTAREIEVLNLISLGLNYKDIAEDLDISPHTVRRHINHIYEKLEVNSKVEALNKARQLGIFKE
jgi:DNA-binding NarL/FixJ family response regulator